MHEEEVPETPQSDESPTFDLVMSTRQKPSRWDQSSQQQPPGERRDPYAFVGTTPPKAGADEGRRRTPVSAGKPPITGYNVLARYERGDDTAAAGKGTAGATAGATALTAGASARESARESGQVSAGESGQEGTQAAKRAAGSTSGESPVGRDVDHVYVHYGAPHKFWHTHHTDDIPSLVQRGVLVDRTEVHMNFCGFPGWDRETRPRPRLPRSPPAAPAATAPATVYGEESILRLKSHN